MRFSTNKFLAAGLFALAGLFLLIWASPQVAAEPLPGGTLNPLDIPKYQAPMIIPPPMPRTGKVKNKMGKNGDYYEIAVRQFQQQVLPAPLPMTTVWSYGSVQYPGTVAEGGTFNFPAFTIEAQWNKPVAIKWINDLVDANGDFLPHLLPVDQTLHWANPPGGMAGRDMKGTDPTPYDGPVPIVTHVHGAHTFQESDGYPEAWYLPAANNIPAGYATTGTYYDIFKASSIVGDLWKPGSALFVYPNDQRATTLWYHDHTLGMTRLNVYAGPAGFYLIRGGPDDIVLDSGTGLPAILPGPAPNLGALLGKGNPNFYEIPIVIQDRSFNSDGSLFYPETRDFFEGLAPGDLADLGVLFEPDTDVAPIWNPEFFANTMVVNGQTWPFLNVEPRRYRLRFLNGCQSRFLILKFSDPAVEAWQIGADGGFLAAPIQRTEILLGPAERADTIVDFTNVPVGTSVILRNLGPDEPFGGGVPGIDFVPADPATTGQVMEFRVVAPGPTSLADNTTPPAQLVLPAQIPLVPTSVRAISLNELESEVQNVCIDDITEEIVGVPPCGPGTTEVPFGPTAALLGTLDTPLRWEEAITENPAVGATEQWEIHNFTMDAHPIHIHLVQFQIANREIATMDSPNYDPILAPIGTVYYPGPEEMGFKDTVIAYPGEITRVNAQFDLAGLFVWHCHILEHEDNEMMRPYQVGP